MTDQPERDAVPDPAADLGPDLETVLDWAEGRLDAAAAEPVERALARGERRVVAIVEWFDGFRAVAAQLPLHDPPSTLGGRLDGVFERWVAVRARPGLRTTRVLLVFDSRQDLVRAGVRGVGADEGTAHLAYTGDEAEVVLDVERLGLEEVSVRGQVLWLSARPAAGVVVEASGPSGVVTSAEGDALGRFTLARVPDDADELRIEDATSALLAAVDLRGSR